MRAAAFVFYCLRVRYLPYPLLQIVNTADYLLPTPKKMAIVLTFLYLTLLSSLFFFPSTAHVME